MREKRSSWRLECDFSILGQTYTYKEQVTSLHTHTFIYIYIFIYMCTHKTNIITHTLIYIFVFIYIYIQRTSNITSHSHLEIIRFIFYQTLIFFPARRHLFFFPIICRAQFLRAGFSICLKISHQLAKISDLKISRDFNKISS